MHSNRLSNRLSKIKAEEAAKKAKDISEKEMQKGVTILLGRMTFKKLVLLLCLDILYTCALMFSIGINFSFILFLTPLPIIYLFVHTL